MMTTRMTILWTMLMCTTALGADPKEITVTLTVPDSAWTIEIDEVYEVKNEVWVLSTVSRKPEVMGMQVISTIRNSVQVNAPDRPVKHIIMGKTWGWKNKEPYRFIKDRKGLEADLKSGKRLYKKAGKKKS